MHIEAFKARAGLDYILTSSGYYSYLKQLYKNSRAYQNVVCNAMCSLVMHTKCFECNLSKEQAVIYLSAMLFLKVHLCLIIQFTLYHYTRNSYL